MKHMFRLAAIAAVTLGTARMLAAGDVTITGEGKCLKCSLKESDKCQNVVETKEGDKVTRYYLTGAASKAYHHDNLCSGSKKVTFTGKCEKKDGKLVVEVSKIEDAK
jgi:Family of unknown function (DUF6370)